MSGLKVSGLSVQSLGFRGLGFRVSCPGNPETREGCVVRLLRVLLWAKTLKYSLFWKGE